jgi:hypothetical protein
MFPFNDYDAVGRQHGCQEVLGVVKAVQTPIAQINGRIFRSADLILLEP